MRGGKGVVGVKQIAENIRALESEAEQGRFSMENVSSGHATNWTHAYALNKKAGVSLNPETSIDKVLLFP